MILVPSLQGLVIIYQALMDQDNDNLLRDFVLLQICMFMPVQELLNVNSTLSPEMSNKSFSNYTNSTLGISLQFPSEWSVIEDATMNQVTFVSPVVPSDIYGINPLIQREYLQVRFIPSKNLTLDEWMNNTHYEYEQSSSYPGFTLEAVTSFGFNGHVDRTFWYSYQGDRFGTVENKTRDTFL